MMPRLTTWTWFPRFLAPGLAHHNTLTHAREARLNVISTRMVAESEYDLLRQSAWVIQGYLGISRPVRDGDQHVVDVSLTELGERALQHLDDDWVWDSVEKRHDAEATVNHWQTLCRGASQINDYRFGIVQSTRLQILKPIRDTCDGQRARIAAGFLAEAANETDPVFNEIARLPDREPFTTLKRESVHRRIQVWAPR
jgi:hypothetical protein